MIRLCFGICLITEEKRGRLAEGAEGVENAVICQRRSPVIVKPVFQRRAVRGHLSIVIMGSVPSATVRIFACKLSLHRTVVETWAVLPVNSGRKFR